MNKNTVIIIALLFLFSCQTEQDQKVTQDPQEIIAVKIAYPQPYSQVQTIKTSGQITAKNNTKYSFKIGGVVKSILVEEGDKISKGQKLATLYTDEIDAQVQQAELALSKAKRDEARIRTLYQDSIATLEAFQNTQTAMEVAERTLSQIQFNQKYTVIYASDNGYITDKFANIGEVVAPGSPLLISSDASNTKGYLLECGLTDREWVNVEVGDSCHIEIDAYPDKSFRGIVTSKSFRADPVSGAFRVELKMLNPEDELAIGMYGSAMINSRKSIEGYTIPYSALILANGKEGQVNTVNNEGQLKRNVVVISELMDDQVLISEGVDKDDRIVITNSAFLNSSSTIKIID